MTSPARQKIPFSELSRRQKVYVISTLVIISGLSGIAFWFSLNWLFGPASGSGVPQTEAQQREDTERAVAKNIENLEKDVGKALRPNKNVQVEAGHRYDGVYFVLAEYKPLLMEAGAIEDEMLEAYKVVYTSGLPVVRAEIVALADLVDGYGNEYEDPVYRSSMDGEQAKLINWGNLRNVSPRVAFSDYWRHPLVR